MLDPRMPRRLAVRRTFVLMGSVSLAAAGIAAATHPAAAAAVLAAAANAVTCSSSRACISGTNTGSGSGVAGSSMRGNGVTGSALQPYSAGVVGNNTTAQPGGIGLDGQAQGNGAGVIGQDPDGTGVFALSSTGTGIFAETSTGNAIFAESSTGAALAAYAGTGSAISVQSSGPGASAAIVAQNTAGVGGDFSGTTSGLVARAPVGGDPLVLTDSSAHDVFHVDGAGNVYYHGSLHHLAAATSGAHVGAYGPSSTAPTLEDTGSAHLVSGAAAVRLDPTFAAAIEASASYRVFITPDGDSPHGLFVAAKTPTGFVVREAQGGRSTLDFDYRIVATALGETGRRMAFANPALTPLAGLPAITVRLVAPPHR